MLRLHAVGFRSLVARPLQVWWLAAMAFGSVSAWETEALAYQWMIRHGYSSCATCHVDPSGAGVLSPYGALIADALLRTRYSEAADDGDDSLGDFAFGQVDLPEPLRLKGDVRGLMLTRKIETLPIERDFIWMQAELAAALSLGSFAASASVGYADEGATLAALTRDAKQNLVSRQHWVGLWTPDNLALVRAGRINLPFGVRTIEHTLWVRALTRTSINDHQSHGVSVYAGGDLLRGELMAVIGNFQVRPDDYRERGYSGYLELIATPALAVGVSSLALHQELDELTFAPTWRQVHGIFSRWATPYKPLVILGELDYTLTSTQGGEQHKGFVGYIQADYEIDQGIHLIATAEANDIGYGDQPTSYAGWFSYAWFFAPHADIRLDSVFYSLGSQFRTTNALALSMQFHVYL